MRNKDEKKSRKLTPTEQNFFKYLNDLNQEIDNELVRSKKIVSDMERQIARTRDREEKMAAYSILGKHLTEQQNITSNYFNHKMNIGKLVKSTIYHKEKTADKKINGKDLPIDMDYEALKKLVNESPIDNDFDYNKPNKEE